MVQVQFSPQQYCDQPIRLADFENVIEGPSREGDPVCTFRSDVNEDGVVDRVRVYGDRLEFDIYKVKPKFMLMPRPDENPPVQCIEFFVPVIDKTLIHEIK